MSKPKVGVLALQGDYEAHEKALARAGASAVEVRTREDLDAVDALVIPGGESTTMLKLAHKFGLWDELQKLQKEIPFWGVCAGSTT